MVLLFARISEFSHGDIAIELGPLGSAMVLSTTGRGHDHLTAVADDQLLLVRCTATLTLLLCSAGVAFAAFRTLAADATHVLDAASAAVAGHFELVRAADALEHFLAIARAAHLVVVVTGFAFVLDGSARHRAHHSLATHDV